MVVEQDENSERLVAKPYNAAEANRQKALEEEQEPKHSLATVSILAQQQARLSKESTRGPSTSFPANSIKVGNDITPSF